MPTLRERLRAMREAERRGLRSFTIGVIEDDLRVIANHGYEGVLSTDPGQQARSLGRFITDMVGCCSTAKVTLLQQRHCNGV
jgi:hypothetical protein